MQIWITQRKIHYQAEPTVVSDQAGGVNGRGSTTTSVKKTVLCQSPVTLAPRRTTSHVLQLSDVHGSHIFDNFLCLAMWSWLSCLQRITFPKAARVVQQGISAMELHLKLMIATVKKCQKVFFGKGHFLTPRDPWECLLEELLGQWKDLGSSSFTRPQEHADLSIDTTRTGQASPAAWVGDIQWLHHSSRVTVAQATST